MPKSLEQRSIQINPDSRATGRAGRKAGEGCGVALFCRNDGKGRGLWLADLIGKTGLKMAKAAPWLSEDQPTATENWTVRDVKFGTASVQL